MDNYQNIKEGISHLIHQTEKNRRKYRLSKSIYQIAFIWVVLFPGIYIIFHHTQVNWLKPLVFFSDSMELYESLGIAVGCILLYTTIFEINFAYKKLYSDGEEKILLAILKKVAIGFQYQIQGKIENEAISNSKLFTKEPEIINQGNGLLIGKVGKNKVIIGNIEVYIAPGKIQSILSWVPFGLYGIMLYKLLKPWFTFKSAEESFPDFLGMFVVMDFNKDLKGTTVILPDKIEGKIGYLAKIVQSLNFGRDELVNLEDPEFEKEFVVYSTDQIEARYILSTSFMERVTALKRKINRSIMLSFHKDKIYVAVRHPYGFFSLPENKNLVISNALELFYEDITTAMGIVEDLDLNTNIWKT